MTGQLNIANSKVHRQDLRRAAETDRSRRVDGATESASSEARVVIRAAGPQDEAAIDRLAQLDSRPRPRAPVVLLAELDGEVLAALPANGGPAVADPFRPTVELVGMLKLRARQLQGETNPGGRLKRGWSALRRATAGPVMAPLAGDVSLPARHDGE